MSNKKRLSVFLLLLTILTPLFMSLQSGRASAETASDSGAWIDKTRIIYEGNHYVDQDPFDGTRNYKASGTNAGSHCGEINVSTNTKATVFYKKITSLGGCENVAPDNKPDSIDKDDKHSFDITLNNSELADITAYRLSQDMLFMPVCEYKKYEGVGGVDLNTKTQAGCTFKRFPKDVSGYAASLYVRFYTSNNTYPFQSSVDEETTGEWVKTVESKQYSKACRTGLVGCKTGSVSIKLANNGDVQQPHSVYGISVLSDGSIVGLGDGTGGGANQEPSCESGGDFSYLLCPALRVASRFLRFVDEKLNDLLTVPSSYYESPELEVAWSRMRNIAYAILIPIMLIMILATALGFDFVSAYTFKKAMPRLVVAILFIALSLEITKFLVVLTNEVGQGILGLVTSSFSGADTITLASLFNPNTATGALFTGGTVVGGILVLGGLVPVLLLFLVSAGLSLLIAFLALAFRQMLLVAFMIIAPLAILSWIFPGNDKLWKLWWGAFSKLLIIFPLIMFLVGAGRGFATMVQQVGSDGFLETVLKLLAYVGPYFFIPAMFKFAGGIFATLTGMANDRSRGVFDRLRNARKKSGEKAWHRAKEGNYFKGGKETGIRGALNKGIMGGTMLNEAGLNPRRMRDRMTNAIGNRELEDSEEIMKSTFGRMLQDDDIASALVDANGDEAAFREILKKRAYARFGGDENAGALEAAVTNMRAAGRKFSAGGLRMAALRSKFNSSTGWNNEPIYETNPDGTFKTDDKGDRIKKKWTQADVDAGRCEQNQVGTDAYRLTASGDMLNDINKVAGRNRILSTQLLAEARAGQSRAGREDTGGGGFSDTAVEMDKLFRGRVEVRDDSGNIVRNADGTAVTREYTLEDATEGVTTSLINGKNIYEIFRSGKPAVARAVAPVLKKMTERSLQQAAATADAAVAPLEAQIEAIRSDPAVQAEIDAEIRSRGEAQVQAITDNPNLTRQEKLARIQAVEPELREAALATRTQTQRAQIEAIRQRQADVVMREIGKEQMFHSVAATSSADVAQTMGNQVFNAPFNIQLLPPKIREVVVQKTGKQQPTHLEVFESLRDDPTWGAYVKEYGRVGGGRAISEEEVQAYATRMNIDVQVARERMIAEQRQQEEAQRAQQGR